MVANRKAKSSGRLRRSSAIVSPAPLRAFVHGHHTRGEIELLNPRWREQADSVLGLLRGYLVAADEIDPIAAREALARQSALLTDRCRARLSSPLWRPLFIMVLRRARAGAVLRENLKNEAVRFIAIGITVAGRRAEHRRNQEAVPPPPIVVGRFDRAGDRAASPEPVDTAQTVLRGFAVSPGRVTGPARVMLRATEDDHVRAGEILVAPFTDPGWTPCFVTAAGIVMDIGGLLSHGSIVAPDPAVVNVGHATTTIRTGQMIEVDGSRGVVQLLDASARTTF